MRRSYRSPLTRMLREAREACCEARALGAPIGEITAVRAERAAASQNRRRFLAGAAASTLTFLPRQSLAQEAPRVVIVGGGIAGLNCAYRLWRDQGIAAKIYEWSDRAGGRIQTLRGYFANGQSAEQHAEFISREHTATLHLAQEFGLVLEDTNAFPRKTRDTYWFSGERYDQEELNADWQDFGYSLFREAVRRAPHANYQSYSKDAYNWDHMSVAEWIDRHVPGGLRGRFGKLCYSDTISEYGGPPEEQSALNLLYILGFDASAPSGYQPTTHPVLAGSDEKWHIAGGNDQLISRLVARLPEDAVHTGHRLIALKENPDRTYTCTFSVGHRTVETIADHVVLALPFTTLREVDLRRVDLSPLKRKAIRSLPLGTNVKIQIQVGGRPWTDDGYTGTALTDAAFDGGWDGSYYETLNGGDTSEIYIAVPGGAQGARLARKYDLRRVQGPAPRAMVADTLAALEPIFPGVTAAWQNGPQLAWVNDGNIDPYLLGAWSQYNVGQYTGFSGVERLQEGNIHFAGEHTSLGFQGYIEGAVRSGARAAAEI
jgi:monoamine oxidase